MEQITCFLYLIARVACFLAPKTGVLVFLSLEWVWVWYKLIVFPRSVRVAYFPALVFPRIVKLPVFRGKHMQIAHLARVGCFSTRGSRALVGVLDNFH